MSADMQYATVFINTPHAFMDLSAYYGKLLGIGQGSIVVPSTAALISLNIQGHQLKRVPPSPRQLHIW